MVCLLLKISHQYFLGVNQIFHAHHPDYSVQQDHSHPEDNDSKPNPEPEAYIPITVLEIDMMSVGNLWLERILVYFHDDHTDLIVLKRLIESQKGGHGVAHYLGTVDVHTENFKSVLRVFSFIFFGGSAWSVQDYNLDFLGRILF